MTSLILLTALTFLETRLFEALAIVQSISMPEDDEPELSQTSMVFKF